MSNGQLTGIITQKDSLSNGSAFNINKKDFNFDALKMPPFHPAYDFDHSKLTKIGPYPRMENDTFNGVISSNGFVRPLHDTKNDRTFSGINNV